MSFSQNWTAIDSSKLPAGDYNSCAMSESGQYQIVTNKAAGIYYSSDYGQTWVQTQSDKSFMSMAVSASGQYAVTNAIKGSNVVYMSSNYGQSWASTQIAAPVVAQSYPIIYPSTGPDAKTIIGDNDGFPWGWGGGQYDYAPNLQAAIAYVKAVSPNAVCACWSGSPTSGGGRINWYNRFVAVGRGTMQLVNGAGWVGIQFADGLPGAPAISTDTTTPTTARTAMSASGQYMTSIIGSGNIYISNNNGSSWTTVSLNKDWVAVAMSASGQYQIASTASNEMYYSSSYGQSWTQGQSVSGQLKSCTMSESGQYACVTTYTGAGIYYSSDYGHTWSASSGITNAAAIAMSASGKNLIAGAINQNPNAIYYSTDYGHSWALTTSNLVSGSAKINGIAMSASGQYVLSVTEGGANVLLSIPKTYTTNNVNLSRAGIVVDYTDNFGSAVSQTLSFANKTLSMDSGLNVTSGDTALSGKLVVAGESTFNGALTFVGASNFNSTMAVSGAASMASTLAVSGAASMASTLAVTGAVNLNNTLAVSNNSSVGGTLTVSGASALNNSLAVAGAANLNSSLAVAGIANMNNNLNVAGAAQMNSSLAVAGVANMNNALNVSGAAQMNSSLAVAGISNLNNALNVGGASHLSSTLLVDGAVTMGNTLTATGAATFNNNMTVNGTSALNGALNVSGASSVGGALNATGAATLNSTLAVTGSSTLGGSLAVAGISNLNNVLNVSGAANLNSSLAVAGNSVVAGSLDVTGNSALSGTLALTGAANLNSSLAVAGNSVLSGTLDLTGDANLNSTLAVAGASSLAGAVTVEGATTLNNNVVINPSVSYTAGGTLYGEYVQVNLSSAKQIDSYTVATNSYSAGFGRLPAKFALVGSNDGTNWIVVDKSTTNNVYVLDSANSAKYCTRSVNANFSYYRLIIEGLTDLSYWYLVMNSFILSYGGQNLFNASNQISGASGSIITNGSLTANVSYSWKGSPNFDNAYIGNIASMLSNTSHNYSVCSIYWGVHNNQQQGYLMWMYPGGVANSNASQTLYKIQNQSAGSFVVNSNSTVNAPLTVSGASALNSTLAVAGAAQMNSSLAVAGAANLNSTLALTGAANLSDSLTVAGASNLNSTLAVSGAATLSNSLAVAGASTLSSTLNVAGAATFQNNLTVNGNLTVLGSQTSIDTVNLQVKDSAIVLADGNVTDVIQTGIQLQYQPSGSAIQYAGLKRLPGTGQFVLFKNSSMTIEQENSAQSPSADVYAEILADSFVCASDKNLKNNIVDIDNALENVEKMRGVYHHWIDDNQSQERQIGVIAQEVQAVYPELVQQGDNGYLAVNYPKLTAVLLQSIKEMNAKKKQMNGVMKKMSENIEQLKVMIKQ